MRSRLAPTGRFQPATVSAAQWTDFVPAMVNLADLDRLRGMDQQGAELLRKAMSIDPGSADVKHSLGLFLVRQHDYPGALELLRQASELAPDNARYAYPYAVAPSPSGGRRCSGRGRRNPGKAPLPPMC
jgi:hypothetical protein